eukprot:NODE_212_length_14557_cov_0.357103.p1 type:complete len:447 gc:universal NODE_212_length_14557_cov_0.357103:341-1681(+)
MKRIIVCCDGTWCGDPTGTSTNIKIIAQAFAGPHKIKSGKAVRHCDNIVCYFNGCGVDGSITDYFRNGALGEDIKSRCLEAYTFIVDNFDLGDQVWMFGLSRGAFTIRSVAGIINNVGIISRTKLIRLYGDGVEDAMEKLCNQAYVIYKDKGSEYKPRADFPLKFKAKYSYTDIYDSGVDCVSTCTSKCKNEKNSCTEFCLTSPPIEFMGLLDTVGALGIPRFQDDNYLEYGFYDTNITSEVKNVYQALSVHDNLAVFQPCFAKRNPNSKRWEGVSKATIEVWFPGAHYDIGRQKFILFRNTKPVAGVIGSLLSLGESMLRSISSRILVISFDEQYSRNVFCWMVGCINKEANAQLINESAYDLAIQGDEWSFLPPFRKNAYEKLLYLMPSKILRDRFIPPHEKSIFYKCKKGGEAQYLSSINGQHSKSYDNRVVLRDLSSIEFTL